MGVPEMEAYWRGLTERYAHGKLSKVEAKDFKKLIKALRFLENDPRHPGLESHEIVPLSRRCKQRVWQSCLESKTPAAGRLFWSYGPGKGEITILGIEPHPEDKKRGGYEKVLLSSQPME
jgi:hypothetical protein